MLYRIWKIIVKDFIQLYRDRLLAPVVLLGPLAELILIAWITARGIDQIPTVVLDQDHSAASRRFVTSITNVRTFDPYYVQSLDRLNEAIEGGEALAAWVIPADFQERLNDPEGESPSLQLIVDGADVMAAQEASNVGRALVSDFGGRFATQPAMSQDDSSPLNVSLRVWFNEELDESYYMIPSELGFIAAAVVTILASLAIARERELGTLEQLMVTPLRSVEMIIGKSVMALTLGYVEFLLMLAMVVWIFDVPMRGSLPLLMVVVLFYMIVELGWGLVVSTMARTQMQAVLIVFAVIMVMFIFSGFAYPVDAMPPFMQVIANFFPIKHWLIVFRSILLKGAGIAVFWRELLAIAGLGGLIYTGAVTLLRQKRLG